jgi:hypothetical protein
LTPQECREFIRGHSRRIDQLHQEVNDLAKQHIEDFHFLDYQVSLFWRCDTSPIGMCVFNLDDWGRPIDCRYCHGPVERK